MIAGWALASIFLGTITVLFFFVLSEKSILIEESYSSSHSTTTASTDPHVAATTPASDTTEGSHGSYSAAVTMVYLALVGVIFFNKFVMGFVLHKITDF